MNADQEPENKYAIDGLTDREVQKLHKEAQTPWGGATIAHLRFQALVAEALKKKNKEGSLGT